MQRCSGGFCGLWKQQLRVSMHVWMHGVRVCAFIRARRYVCMCLRVSIMRLARIFLCEGVNTCMLPYMSRVRRGSTTHGTGTQADVASQKKRTRVLAISSSLGKSHVRHWASSISARRSNASKGQAFATPCSTRARARTFSAAAAGSFGCRASCAGRRTRIRPGARPAATR